ncbi:MAG: helix-turn-helix domain-containing protein [Actinobacteria bacterium]|nr:helix-turn-helix domain-containing protein [Actinomycetota bacterium]
MTTRRKAMDDRMLMSRQEAARVLNMSLSHFQRHVQPRLPCVRSGQLRLYRNSDLERWADEEVRAGTIRSRSGEHGLAAEQRRFIADCEAGVALNKLGRPYKRNAIVDLDSSLRRLPEEMRHKPLDASVAESSRRSWTGSGAKDSPARGSDP